MGQVTVLAPAVERRSPENRKDPRWTPDSPEETRLTSRCQCQCHAQRITPQSRSDAGAKLWLDAIKPYSPNASAGRAGHAVEWRPQNMRHRTIVRSPLVRASHFRLGPASPPGDWPLHVVCGNRKVQPGVPAPPHKHDHVNPPSPSTGGAADVSELMRRNTSTAG